MESTQEPQQQEQPTSQTKSSHHSNNIRSRITVVCAECKRLKLRCDRRSPCGSCVKRDTVDRCKYSQAATEKVDLQSVNNRVLALEAQVALLISTGASLRTNAQPDRSVLATGSSGSSLAISLDDITSTWLSHLHFAPNMKLKLETAPVELPTDELLPTTLFPPIADFRASSSPLEPPSVTAQLISRLPASAEERHNLSNVMEDTLSMYPCFNIPHFLTRIQGMFTWAKDTELSSMRDQFPNSSGGRTGIATKPTLSFFAAVSAAFALSALGKRTNDNSAATMGVDDHTTPSGLTTSDNESSSPAALLALSEQALAVFEKSYNYDLDYLIAMILQVVFFLHHGKPRLAHILFPLVGKMVNIARMMGLGIDPDDVPGTYTLFDAETRRRVWWDIFYYDLFVSDCMGHHPLIADNSFTTRLPADVDEQQFNPFSTSLPVPHESCKSSSVYFGLKCRLAQLVKDLKKRTFKDPLSDPDSAELSIEEAMEFESKISQFIAGLPPECQTDTDVSSSLASNGRHASPLLARSCELNIIANRLILTLYLPFMKANPANPPHQASLATVNAAHKIVQNIKAWKVWKNRGSGKDREKWGLLGVCYEYGRILFDAAVVCASMCIDCHDSAFAHCIKDDVNVALEIMKEMEKAKLVAGNRRVFPVGVGAANRLEGNVNEGVAIVEMLKEKADAARAGPSLKRKRQDGDKDLSFSGFRIPFVGAGVTSAGTVNVAQQLPGPLPPSFAPNASPTISRPASDSVSSKIKVEASKVDLTLDFTKRSKDKSLEKEKGAKDRKDKNKAQKYPPYGIRIRPGLAPPYARCRTSSQSSSTILTNSSCSSPHGLIQPSMSEGTAPQSYESTPKLMLPPGSSATPLSIGPPTPIQNEGYFSTPTSFTDDLAHMQELDPRSSMTKSFPDSSMSSSDSHIDPTARRFGTPTFGGNSSKSFYDQPYGSGHPSPPTNTQSTPPFSTMSHNGQYGSLSQHQPDFYINSPRNYDFGPGLDLNGTNTTGFNMNPAEHRQSTSLNNSSFMTSLDKMPMDIFSMSEADPASSNLGSAHFNGPDRRREGEGGMDLHTGHDWPPPVNSASGTRDTYWTLKPHPE